MDKKQIRLRQMKLGKQIHFLDKLEELIKKDAIPELIDDVHNENDLESAVRLAKLLNETSEFLKETVCRQARIEAELMRLHDDVTKLIPATENK